MGDAIEFPTYEVPTPSGKVRIQPLDINYVRVEFFGEAKINGVPVKGAARLRDYGTGYVREQGRHGPHNAASLTNAAGAQVPHKTYHKAVDLACDAATHFAKTQPSIMQHAGVLRIRADRERIESERSELREKLADADAQYAENIKAESRALRHPQVVLREAHDRDADELARQHPVSAGHTRETVRQRLSR